MANAASQLWKDALSGLRCTFEERHVLDTCARIDNGLMPEHFYTLTTGAQVLLLGLGSGVEAFRLATWDISRHIVCIERDARELRVAKKLASDLGLSCMSFFSSLDDMGLAESERIGLLIIDGKTFSLAELDAVLSRYAVMSVIGNFTEERAEDSTIYRLCSEKSASFHFTNLTSGENIVGKRHVAPEVTTIVVPTVLSQHVERCVRSLFVQSRVRQEIIIAYSVEDAELAEAARRWQQENPDLVKIVVVDSSASAEKVVAALNAATGEYIAFIDASDWCEPNMLERLYGAAAPGRAEAVVSAYRLMHCSDGGVVAKFTVGQSGIDLRLHAGWISCASALIEVRPVLGRYLFSRAFLVKNKIVWPTGVSDFEDAAFQALCLVAAKRVIGVAGIYYNHRESLSVAIQSDGRKCDFSSIKSMVDLLQKTLLRDGSYFRELVFKRLIIWIYVEIYSRQKGLRNKILVLRNLLDDLVRCSFYMSVVELALLRKSARGSGR
ncbi:MAG: glycosyltransferase [Acidobacteriaceae bacterium]